MSNDNTPPVPSAPVPAPAPVPVQQPVPAAEPPDSRWMEPAPRNRREGQVSGFPEGVTHEIRILGAVAHAEDDEDEHESPVEHVTYAIFYGATVLVWILFLTLAALVLNWATQELEEHHALPAVVFIFKALEVGVAALDGYAVLAYVASHVFKSKKRRK